MTGQTHLIIDMLKLERQQTANPDVIDALITDLAAGAGASKGAGGRPKKDERENPIRTDGVNGRTATTRKSSLAARMAESPVPRIQKIWKEHLAGKYKTVTAAAIAAGLRDDGNAPPVRIRQYWKRLSAGERREFLKWIKEQS